MQELAEAGARVLNAQAVEFAKERGIAIYARSTFGGPGETVVRRYPPRAPGRVIGVTSERGLVLLESRERGAESALALLAALDAGHAGGKQLQLTTTAEDGLHTSLVLSLENLHDFQGLRAAIDGRVSLREGVGAVSAIGTGINASFGNVRTAIETIRELGAPLLGLSTSSFRISALVPEAATDDTLRRLHERLVEAEPVL